MKTFVKLLAIPAIVALGACTTKEVGPVVQTASGATIQSVVSASLNNKAALTEVYIPGKGYTHMVDRGPSVQGDLAKVAVGSVVPALINAGAGVHIAHQNRKAATSGCGSNCGGGNTFVIQGGTATSSSVTDGTITADFSSVVGACGTDQACLAD